ncbi:MAG: UvrB/UvrC motif-containing protein, partial [Clostridia bacterium]|nr:UvrB/UvrC motif-containing protein [Clostridia bacterium]
ITPKSIVKAVGETITAVHEEKSEDKPKDNTEVIEKLKAAMLQASEELRFEDAARIRDRILKLKREKK